MKHNFTWVLLDCRAKYVYHVTRGDGNFLDQYRGEVTAWLKETGTGVWVDRFRVALNNELVATAFLLRWA